MEDQPSARLAERAYQHFLPRIPYLGDERQRLWIYFKLWLNIAFDIYPDRIRFMRCLTDGGR